MGTKYQGLVLKCQHDCILLCSLWPWAAPFASVSPSTLCQSCVLTASGKESLTFSSQAQESSASVAVPVIPFLPGWFAEVHREGKPSGPGYCCPVSFLTSQDFLLTPCTDASPMLCTSPCSPHTPKSYLPGRLFFALAANTISFSPVAYPITSSRKRKASSY